MRAAYVALLLIFAFLPRGAVAQGAATLLADNVYITADNQLIAEGNVEAFYDGIRLSAARIVYSQTTDRLVIEGPIFIQSPDGAIITADFADLDSQLQNGVLRGARLVLDQQLQLAANQMDRVAGRYTQLYKVAVTSCNVCSNRPPLWQIRAERIVHDQEAQQLYFENAVILVRDVPVFWVPRMRLPDPTLTRATGLLIPQIRSSDLLGLGIKLPYFIKIGDQRDLTLTPYLSTNTRTLEARYRQAYLNGQIEVNAAISDDNIRPGPLRAYLFVEGKFQAPRDYQLDFDLELTSDRAYLLEYGYSNKDRLDSEISLLRVREDALIEAALVFFESLRDGESNLTEPTVLGEISWEKELQPRRLGGTLSLALHADTLLRRSNSDGDDGRDVARFGFSAGWQNTWLAGPGFVIDADLMLRGDFYSVAQDVAFGPNIRRLTPGAALTLSWPLARQTPNASFLVTPTVQLAWSENFGDAPPNEDANRIEFDETNLFELSRFAGHDAPEQGLRANIGLNWTRLGQNGSQSSLTFGKIIRAAPVAGYSATSGLGVERSDWLLAGQIDLNNGLSLRGRVLFDDGFSTSKSEALLSWQNARLDLSAGYLFLIADADEGLPNSVSEWSFDGRYQISDAWSVSADARYDLVVDAPANAGIGISYDNECVRIGLSVSRRFTSSATVQPSTDVDLTITLNGFSAGRSRASAATGCRG